MKPTPTRPKPKTKAKPAKSRKESIYTVTFGTEGGQRVIISPIEDLVGSGQQERLRRILRSLREGQTTVITSEGKRIAKLVPIKPEKPKMPDFLGRIKATFGNRTLGNPVLEERESYE